MSKDKEQDASPADRARTLDHERQKLAAILNNDDTAFVVIDDANRLIWANEAFRASFTREELNFDELLGMTCNQILCGRSTRCEACPCTAALGRGAVARHELRLWVRDRFLHILATAMPLRTTQGEASQTLVMLQDVSGLEILRRSEEAFRTSERRFRSIFDGVASGMVTLKIDGTFLQVNPAFCTMLGYTGSELLSRPFVEVLHPDERPAMEQQLHEVMTGARQVIECEQRLRRRDGNVVWGHTHAVLQYDPQGKPAYTVGMVQDITQRKQAQTALQESKRRYQTLVNAIDGIVWETDADSPRFSFVSRKAEELLGYPLERWLTQPRFWRNHLHTDDLQRVVSAYAEAVEQRSGLEIEYRMISEGGAPVWLRDRVTVGEDDDGKVRLRGVMVDITARREAEEALRRGAEQRQQSEKMDAIGRVAGAMAHDFNNLLTTLGGHADFLARGLDEGHPLARELAGIERALSRAGELTERMLALDRRSGRPADVLDLTPTVSGLEDELRGTLGERVRLVLSLAEDLPRVRANAEQIGVVVRDLALNAREAMPEGGDLTVQTTGVEVGEDNALLHPGVPAGRYALVRVSDTGHGMDTQTQAHVFEPFFTTKGDGQSAGLGLATVYAIVSQSEGMIRVESQPGLGTTFTIYLPALDEAPRPAGRPAATVPDLSVGTETVLLVEDDETVRELARRVLELSGYMVIEAADGTEALAMCRSERTPVDLLATDLAMPRMGGKELAERVLEVLPDLKVLFFSGYPAEELLREGRLDAEAPFLQKPFSPAALSRKVRQVLDGA